MLTRGWCLNFLLLLINPSFGFRGRNQGGYWVKVKNQFILKQRKIKGKKKIKTKKEKEMFKGLFGGSKPKKEEPKPVAQPA